MKKYLICGGILIALGIVLLLSGKLWGALVLVAGFGGIFVSYGKMMRGSGFDPHQGTINGLKGQGKQQSDAVKAEQPVMGEQSADIWKQLEKKE